VVSWSAPVGDAQGGRQRDRRWARGVQPREGLSPHRSEQPRRIAAGILRRLPSQPRQWRDQSPCRRSSWTGRSPRPRRVVDAALLNGRREARVDATGPPWRSAFARGRPDAGPDAPPSRWRMILTIDVPVCPDRAASIRAASTKARPAAWSDSTRSAGYTVGRPGCSRTCPAWCLKQRIDDVPTPRRKSRQSRTSGTGISRTPIARSPAGSALRRWPALSRAAPQAQRHQPES